MVFLAAIAAHVTFWVLMLVGWDELWPKRTTLFLVMWLTGFAGRSLVPYGAGLFAPYVALLAVTLVFVVFKGDIRVS
ncbi:MAG: hypothetical protein CL477_12645 [Acidobacteria bacterium]|jgi:hypothetical protein|nr:hypothetical protein [Acidobacteriota bacterium]MDP7339944.1 hypothetical protein [Vicinamibacterales bacterium]MDP7480511.1 hypothetical protein [Vicinamibacterales bacterium]HJN43571.1 hypothetical protein [Vicinamibacterales bacterium]|tara:strand:- start:304 stop:534 length:231 start_codon:yes stop_codon:yes gene_type:complete